MRQASIRKNLKTVFNQTKFSDETFGLAFAQT